MKYGAAEAVKIRRSRDVPLLTIVDHVGKNYGRVDILFANARSARLGPFEAVTEEDYDYTFDINAKGTFFTVQKLLPLIPNGGSVILNTSIVGYKGKPDFSVYSAPKAAIRSFARTLTTDLKERRIRVNALAPGHTATDIGRKSGIPDRAMEEFNARVVAEVPMGRIGRRDDIAKAALFLASDDSSYVSGIELSVDGGWAQV